MHTVWRTLTRFVRFLARFVLFLLKVVPGALLMGQIVQPLQVMLLMLVLMVPGFLVLSALVAVTERGPVWLRLNLPVPPPDVTMFALELLVALLLFAMWVASMILTYRLLARSQAISGKVKDLILITDTEPPPGQPRFPIWIVLLQYLTQPLIILLLMLPGFAALSIVARAVTKIALEHGALPASPRAIGNIVVEIGAATSCAALIASFLAVRLLIARSSRVRPALKAFIGVAARPNVPPAPRASVTERFERLRANILVGVMLAAGLGFGVVLSAWWHDTSLAVLVIIPASLVVALVWHVVKSRRNHTRSGVTPGIIVFGALIIAVVAIAVLAQDDTLPNGVQWLFIGLTFAISMLYVAIFGFPKGQ